MFEVSRRPIRLQIVWMDGSLVRWMDGWVWVASKVKKGKGVSKKKPLLTSSTETLGFNSVIDLNACETSLPGSFIKCFAAVDALSVSRIINTGFRSAELISTHQKP